MKYYQKKIGFDPLVAKSQLLGYRPYIPPRGEKGIPPRLNEGMNLNTGEVDPAHRLAYANPTLDSRKYINEIMGK